MGTPKKAAQGAQPSKFQTILAATGQDVLDQRAKVMYNKTATAMNNKLTNLRSKRDDLELAILNLADLSVDSKDSLRPGNAGFNPSEWVDRLCSLNMDLALNADEITIAEQVAFEYFGIAPEEVEA
jgi:hypothetical protein